MPTNILLSQYNVHNIGMEDQFVCFIMQCTQRAIAEGNYREEKRILKLEEVVFQGP